MKYFLLPVFSLVLLLNACSTLPVNQKNTRSSSKLNAEGEVVSVWELSSEQQEIGVRLQDGRTVPVKLDRQQIFFPGQKVQVIQDKTGSRLLPLS